MEDQRKDAIHKQFAAERSQRRVATGKQIKAIEQGEGRWKESASALFAGVVLVLIALPILAYDALFKRNEPKPWAKDKNPNE